MTTEQVQRSQTEAFEAFIGRYIRDVRPEVMTVLKHSLRQKGKPGRPSEVEHPESIADDVAEGEYRTLLSTSRLAAGE